MRLSLASLAEQCWTTLRAQSALTRMRPTRLARATMRLDDFWLWVDSSGGKDACWPWLRAINASGYGSVWIEKESRTASRVAYELTNGYIPEGPGYHGFVVMHAGNEGPKIITLF